MNDKHDYEALKTMLITMLARLERLESIVGQIHDREDCRHELNVVAAEHYHTGAFNRRGLPIPERMEQIKSIFDKPQN